MTEISFIIYQIIISTRIFIEMEDLTVSVFIHQLFWFNSVLMFFFICFRYILNIEKDRLSLLSAGSILTFIPITYAKLAGEHWALNYIQPVSFKQVIFDLITLLFKHEYNWPMFPELAALLIGSIALALYLSKNIKLSIISSLTAVYGSFLLLGFSWISVNPEHPTLFLLKSGLEDGQFYALQLITYFSVLSTICFHKELCDIFKTFSKPCYPFSVFLILSAIFQGTYLFLFTEKVAPADIFVTFFPACSIVLSILLVLLYLFRIKTLRFLFLPVWIMIFSIITLFSKSL
ncbi:MAG TPA: hypothetical protein VLJ60_11925 [bacterium]|nr:hypothetical protein [bacterium]